jgi:hypothetical protein
MLVNPYRFCVVIFLVILGIDAEYACSAPATIPVAPRQRSAIQWSSIPEDSTRWRREPFKISDISPQKTAGASVKNGTPIMSPDLSLQGIMKSNRRYYAIINGRTVKPGDRIEGWTISEIGRYRVIFRRENEKQIYDIYQGKIDRGTR